eukprot:gene44735-13144_t
MALWVLLDPNFTVGEIGTITLAAVWVGWGPPARLTSFAAVSVGAVLFAVCTRTLPVVAVEAIMGGYMCTVICMDAAALAYDEDDRRPVQQ